MQSDAQLSEETSFVVAFSAASMEGGIVVQYQVQMHPKASHVRRKFTRFPESYVPTNNVQAILWAQGCFH